MTNEPAYFMRDQVDGGVDDIMAYELGGAEGRESEIWPALALVVAAVSVVNVMWMVPQ